MVKMGDLMNSVFESCLLADCVSCMAGVDCLN